jgi:hypothetical protein
VDEYCQTHQKLWDQWTGEHETSAFYDLAGFRAGKDRLRSIELAELGDVAGKSLLHLQCHFGMDTLVWARRDAIVTGADFSEKSIALARALSHELAIPAQFHCLDIYQLPDQLKELLMSSNLTEQTAATLQHHLTAIAQGDLGAILSDYCAESTLFLPDKTLHGLEEVSGFFANLLATLPANWMADFKMIRQDVAGEAAYIFWQASPVFPMATDTFVVRDGKIIVQTFAMLAPL